MDVVTSHERAVRSVRSAEREVLTVPDVSRRAKRAGENGAPTEVVVTPGVYPSGTGYLMVMAGNERIVGHIHRVEGGYVRFGCKKPRSLQDATRDVIRVCLRKAEANVALFSALLGLPVNVAAVDPQVASTGKPTTRA